MKWYKLQLQGKVEQSFGIEYTRPIILLVKMNISINFIDQKTIEYSNFIYYESDLKVIVTLERL